MVESSSGARSLNWKPEEVALALDLYLRRGPIANTDPEAIELSQVLRALEFYPVDVRPSNFRSPSAVVEKLYNLASLDPAFTGAVRSNRSQTDEAVWSEWHDRPAELRVFAEELRRSVHPAGGARESSAPSDQAAEKGPKRSSVRVGNREAVLAAVKEFDLLGRDAFLEKYGFEKSRNYPLEIDGRPYDSMAILAAAHRRENPGAAPIGPEDFPEGFVPVRGEFEGLGFSLRLFDGSDHPDPGYWWRGRPEERYWVEVRRAQDGLGTELRAGIRDSNFKINSWYELLAELRPGDVVFHWHRDSQAFVGASRVASSAKIDLGRGDRTVALAGFAAFQTPVSRADLLRVESQLLAVRDVLTRDSGVALHLPFAFRSDGIRLMQNYFGKLPRGMAEILFESVLPGLAVGSSEEVDEVAALIDEVAGRKSGGRRDGRGYRMNARERRAIELRAMKVATAWLEDNGWPHVLDMSTTESYDLLASDGQRSIKVEVKGTTSTGASILLTKNERWLHAEIFPDNGLVVVSQIELQRGEDPVATGGVVAVRLPWELDEARLTPLAFSYEVPPLDG